VPERGRHLAKLAHELKTPLSAITAAAEIMRDGRFGPLGDPRYQGYAADIFDSATHALGVINAMLGGSGLAGATGDRTEGLAFAELELNALVERVASTVRALLEAVGLTIEHRLEPGLPHVIADPVTVRQMLLNLVTNAMRATPPGGSIVIATAYTLAGPVHVSVTDTGSGMSPSDIARALDPLRLADFTATPSGGVGLGFPLILSLARLNGAHVDITSAEGAGTTVQISFAPDRVIPV
jgi:two-component system, cell cycle sensor histidine kinase PleC